MGSGVVGSEVEAVAPITPNTPAAVHRTIHFIAVVEVLFHQHGNTSEDLNLQCSSPLEETQYIRHTHTKIRGARERERERGSEKQVMDRFLLKQSRSFRPVTQPVQPEAPGRSAVQRDYATLSGLQSEQPAT